MKRFLKIWYLLGIVLTLQSCDSGFENLNTDPDAVEEPTAAYLFTLSQLDALNPEVFCSHVITSGGFMQHFATYKDVPSLGDRYTWSQGNYPYAFFNTVYPNFVNVIGEVIRAVEDDANEVNLLSAARIWRVLVFQQITDFYGDVPYSEAGEGYAENLYTPVYDEQSDIYEDLLNELEESINAFDSSKDTFGSSDLLYGGDITQWKKFAYSLMLRISMRLTKVDETMAETWAKKAIAGGVITEDDDLARVEYVEGSSSLNYNPFAYALMSNDYSVANGTDNTEGGKYSKTFIDYLKNTNDPRLSVISIVWVNGVADTTSSIQEGMPNGLVGGSAPDNFSSLSEPNPETLLDYTAPYLVLTNSEMYLLLAEAALRGWYAGDAGECYNNAIGASMRHWALYNSTAGAISDSRIEAYIEANPFDDGTYAEKMARIHTQFWVSLFPNEIEIYANWRRTGYPELTPVNVEGNLTGGTIPRRLIYPPDEESLNGENYAAAVARIDGGNVLTGRVWWDVEE